MSPAITTLLANQEFTGSAALASSLAHRSPVRRTRIEVSTRQPRVVPVELQDGYSLTLSFTEAEPDWLYPVLSAIKEYSSYPRNWDSYGGLPTTFVAAYTALDFLSRALPASVPTPAVVPGSSGSLQFEWHHTLGDLEITVGANGTTSIGFTDATTGDDSEIPVNDVARLTAIFAAL